MTRPLIAVFGSSQTERGDPTWDAGVRLGRLLTRGGADVVTGGYGGLMEAVAEGAAATGGSPIGVTAHAVFPGRTGANPYITREIDAPSLSQRIATIVEMADAAVAMPGSIGTLAELVVAWNEAFVAPFRGATSKPVLAVGETWRRLVDEVVRLAATDDQFVTCVADIDEAVDVLAQRLARFSRSVG